MKKTHSRRLSLVFMINAGFKWGVGVSEGVKLCANPHPQKYLIDHIFLLIDSFYFSIKMIYYIQNRNPRIMINAYLC